jgi:hypothetical protein
MWHLYRIVFLVDTSSPLSHAEVMIESLILLTRAGKQEVSVRGSQVAHTDLYMEHSDDV